MAITETTYGPKRYLTIKKTVSFDQIMDKNMYDEAGTKLGAYMAQYGLHPVGGWTVMYFNWNMESKTSDLGIAFPIDGLEKIEDTDQNTEFSIVDLPVSAASTELIMGPYSEVSNHLKDVHMALNEYMAEKDLKQGSLPIMALEEYATNPETEPDQSKWETHVYYFHE